MCIKHCYDMAFDFDYGAWDDESLPRFRPLVYVHKIRHDHYKI